MESIVIVSAARTAIGAFNGCFAECTAPTLASHVIKGLLEKSGLTAQQVDEVILGCVLPAGIGQAPARQAALQAGMPYEVVCTTVNKVCGSGMKAIMLARNILLAHEQDIVLAGGMENMSLAPYLLKKARFGYRLGADTLYDHMMLDGLEDAYTAGKAMGYFAELCAEQFRISRKEQDEYTLSSLTRSQQALQQNAFKNEIIPVSTTVGKQVIEVTRDQGIENAKPEKIPLLKPVFVENGTITAANASGIADGAAALILARETTAQQMRLPIMAKVIGQYTHAQQPEEFTLAPIAAIEGLLDRIGWSSDDVDLFEINEAFAVVVLITMRQLGLDHDKVNVNGGSCILGHPIGASGARIVVTLLHALHHRGLKRGVACLCIGGGEATAIAIEVC